MMVQSTKTNAGARRDESIRGGTGRLALLIPRGIDRKHGLRLTYESAGFCDWGTICADELGVLESQQSSQGGDARNKGSGGVVWGEKNETLSALNRLGTGKLDARELINKDGPNPFGRPFERPGGRL